MGLFKRPMKLVEYKEVELVPAGVKISVATQSKRGGTRVEGKRDEFGCDQLQLLDQDQSVKPNCHKQYNTDIDGLDHDDHVEVVDDASEVVGNCEFLYERMMHVVRGFFSETRHHYCQSIA